MEREGDSDRLIRKDRGTDEGPGIHRRSFFSAEDGSEARSSDKAGRTSTNGWKKAKRTPSVARRRPRMRPMHESVRPLHEPIRPQAQSPRDCSSTGSNNCTLPVPSNLVAVVNVSSMEHNLTRKCYETNGRRRMVDVVSFVTSSWSKCCELAC